MPNWHYCQIGIFAKLALLPNWYFCQIDIIAKFAFLPNWHYFESKILDLNHNICLHQSASCAKCYVLDFHNKGMEGCEAISTENFVNLIVLQKQQALDDLGSRKRRDNTLAIQYTVQSSTQYPRPSTEYPLQSTHYPDPVHTTKYPRPSTQFPLQSTQYPLPK